MFVSVAVPVPALPALTYRMPLDRPAPARGARVLVPLGARTMTGCILGLADAPEDDTRVREIIDVLDDDAFLPSTVVDLALWVAEYYLTGPGDALAAAMPPGAWVESERRFRITDAGRLAQPQDPVEAQVLSRIGSAPRTARALSSLAPSHRIATILRGLERAHLVERVDAMTGRAQAFRTAIVAVATPAGLSAAQGQAAGLPLGARQKTALDVLAELPAGASAGALRERGVDLGTLRRLAGRGLVHLREERHERDPFAADLIVGAEWSPDRPVTEEQAQALEGLLPLLQAGAFHTALLHGVTGSGKTEIYLRLARHALDAGRRVLVLVPEIALTPQVAALFRAAFGTRVAIQHSGLVEGERHDQWHRIRRGDVDLVVGTRSAVFAPIDRLGLLIVDEEHDTSYKQEEAPRYHGRDVAIVRARSAGALVVLGSATPALETYFNSDAGRYTRVTLTRRVLDRPLAAVRVIDMREEYASEGPDAILSRELIAAIESRRTAGEQTMLLLNRRGFATSVLCRQCAHTLDCPNCSVSLTVHRARQGASRAVCHYCNYSMRVPTACVKCAAPYLEHLGFGTARVLEEVEHLFPGVRAARIDRDTTQKRGALQALLGQFRRGDLDVIVGTQMLAKGHDFPRVTLVGVVSADIGLGIADFRAAERTFQLLTQVAGRAGRGAVAGEALIQTVHPDHYSIRLACRQDYVTFFREELRYRQAMRYPPAVGLVNLVVKGPTYARSMQDASDLAGRLTRDGPHAFALLGPAPAPLARLRGEYRAQLFLKTRRRNATRAVLQAVLASMPELRRRVMVDVDPVGML